MKEVGSSTSTSRTPEQTVAARFWAEAPVQQAHGSFRKFVRDHELDVVDASRFMAMVSVTYADGIIACFDAKYHFKLWRPITAIRAGHTDGNEETVGDPTWSTLLPGTPNHPEYPSAHSCLTPCERARHRPVPGTSEIDFTIPSLTGLGDRHYAACERPCLRRRQRPHLGRDPLPDGGRGRHHDRQEDGRPRARPPLPQVEFLDSSPRRGRRWCPRRGSTDRRPRGDAMTWTRSLA